MTPSLHLHQSLATPPLAPKVIHILNGQGIQTIADLQTFTPNKAFLLIRNNGLSVTQSVYWQLVALSLLKTPQELNPSERLFWAEQLKNTPPVAAFPPQTVMETHMQAALEQAELAASKGEVPVGAIVVRDGKIIARAYNRCIADNHIGSHAEILALQRAGQIIGNYRLSDCDLYVSLEPCSMCAGAVIQARIRRLIYACAEPKTGAAGSVINLFDNTALNSHTAVKGGILDKKARLLLQNFFKQRRA